MAISVKQGNKISALLKEKIRHKLREYSPETRSMPFHFRLLGKDRMALYSFIQSVNTMLGQSIFEKVSEIIAGPNFDDAKSQYKFEGYLSDKAVLAIDEMMLDLRSAKLQANESEEDKKIRAAASQGTMGEIRKTRADLFALKDNVEYYFEIKTVKPNIDVFTKTKEKLLQWKALRYSKEQEINVKAYISIPYNPEAPKPYSRWTLQGLFDLKREVLVAEEYWDFLGGKRTYEELLNIFERTGIELREEINNRLSEFQ